MSTHSYQYVIIGGGMAAGAAAQGIRDLDADGSIALIAAEQAPPLAPPIDIRPPPTPRRAPARASADDRPRPPAAIPGERSRSGGLFDLFGVAR